MSVPQIFYRVRCNHIVKGLPTLVSGPLWCPWNQDYFPIIDVIVTEWRAKCYGCRFARWAGMDKKTASMFADSHARKNPGHRVTVEKTINPEAQKTKDKFDAWKVHSA